MTQSEKRSTPPRTVPDDELEQLAATGREKTAKQKRKKRAREDEGRRERAKGEERMITRALVNTTPLILPYL